MSSFNIRTVSKRHWGTQAEPGETVIAIDRSNPVLGNRHVLYKPKDIHERTSVIAAYEKDLDADFERGGVMYQAVVKIAERVQRGEHVALECWCAPLPCHGDSIIRGSLQETEKIVR